ncbi:MAG: hypothetical protein ACJA2W_002666 [Planctomycetota bacterium]|jgi:hypothetical protein
MPENMALSGDAWIRHEMALTLSIGRLKLILKHPFFGYDGESARQHHGAVDPGRPGSVRRGS